MEYNSILFEKREKTAIITFNRPESMNAIAPVLMDEVQDALQIINEDTEIGCAIVTGAGKAFMAGADLKLFSMSDSSQSKSYNDRIIAMNNAFDRLRVPVIAAINGYAMGGGLELALACSIRVASTKAKMALPEVKLGIIPGSGGTQRLPRLIPRGRALKLLLTGDSIDAKEAYFMGVVDDVTEPDELLPFCLAMAERINMNGPFAVEMVKKCVGVGMNMAFEEAMEYTTVQISTLKNTSDSSEGARAFTEKRPPIFKRQ